MDIIVNGSPVKEYLHEDQRYIEGKKDTPFTIRLRNDTNKRALYVLTVDGISVISGKEGSYNSKGYIIPPRDSIKIKGWRTSDDSVAQFLFTDGKDSYGAKIGQSDNLGVIGCAVFNEKPKHTARITYGNSYWPIFESDHDFFKDTIPYDTVTSAMNSGAGGGSKDVFGSSGGNGTGGADGLSVTYTTASTYSVSSLGTGFGDETYSPAITANFDREDDPTSVMTIYYDTRKNLEAKGVKFVTPVYIAPSAFPKDEGYCKPPYESHSLKEYKVRNKKK